MNSGDTKVPDDIYQLQFGLLEAAPLSTGKSQA